MIPSFSVAPLRVRDDYPDFLNPMLAKEIEARWHQLGHDDVRVWTDKQWNTMTEIRSNLVNGLPPRLVYSRAA